jgi:hypothetical protein
MVSGDFRITGAVLVGLAISALLAIAEHEIPILSNVAKSNDRIIALYLRRLRLKSAATATVSPLGAMPRSKTDPANAAPLGASVVRLIRRLLALNSEFVKDYDDN